MNWFDYLLLAWWAVGTIATVAVVGKPRKPIEPSTAAGVLVINGLLVTGLLFSRGVL